MKEKIMPVIVAPSCSLKTKKALGQAFFFVLSTLLFMVCGPAYAGVPTVTLEIAGGSARTNQSPLTGTITISEAATAGSLTAADLTVTRNGTAVPTSGYTVAVDPNNALIYNVSITSPTNNATYEISMLAGVFTSASTSEDNTAGTAVSTIFDNFSPTITMTSTPTSVAIGDTSTIRLQLSETPTGFTAGDITATNGAVSGFTAVAGVTNAFEVTFTPSANVSGNAVISVAAGAFTDVAGNDNIANSVTVSVDTDAPTVTITASPVNVGIGDTSTIRFQVSEASTGFAANDITVTNGAITGFAAVSGVSNAFQATFTPNNNVTANAVFTIAAGAFTDGAGNNNTVASGVLNVDTVQPGLFISFPSTPIFAGQTPTVTFQFAESVTDFLSDDITVTGGTLGALSPATGSGSQFTATFTPTANSTANVVITVRANAVSDVAGNDNGRTFATAVVDTVVPTVSVSRTATSTLNVGDTATVTIDFSEVPVGFDIGDISASNGTVSNLQVVSNTRRTVTFTPASSVSGSGTVSIASTTFRDATGGNPNTASNTLTIPINTVAPTVTITSSRTGVIVASQTTTIRFQLSEAPTGFTASDITATNGTVSGFTAVTGVTNAFEVTFTPSINFSGNAVISVPAGSFQNAATNDNVAATISISVDTIPPRAVITFSTPNVAIGGTATVRVQISETHTGFTASDITTTNGTLSGFAAVAGVANAFEVTFTPAANVSGTAVISIAAGAFNDTAGNVSIGASRNLTVDTLRPTLSITFSPSPVLAGQTSTVTFQFSEAVTGFLSNDITTTGGTLGTLSPATGSGTQFTATFTPTANSTTAGQITVRANAVSDSNGNDSNVAFSGSSPVDTIVPTVSVSASNASLNSTATSTITLNFSEVPVGLALADISATNGVMSNLQQVNTLRYTATFTPSANFSGSGSVLMASSVFTDAAGNPNSASNTVNIQIDTALPTATIAFSQVSPNNISPLTGTVTLSEAAAASTFTAADLEVRRDGTQVTGIATLTAVVNNPLSYTFRITPSVNEGTYSVVIPASSFTDAAGNGNVVSNVTTLIYDAIPATFTLATDSGTVAGNNVNVPENTSTDIAATPINGVMVLTFSEAVALNSQTLDAGLSGTLNSAGDSYTVSLPGGADFENPADPGNDNTFNVTLRFLDRANNITSFSGIVMITNEIDEPIELVQDRAEEFRAGVVEGIDNQARARMGIHSTFLSALTGRLGEAVGFSQLPGQGTQGGGLGFAGSGCQPSHNLQSDGQSSVLNYGTGLEFNGSFNSTTQNCIGGSNLVIVGSYDVTFNEDNSDNSVQISTAAGFEKIYNNKGYYGIMASVSATEGDTINSSGLQTDFKNYGVNLGVYGAFKFTNGTIASGMLSFGKTIGKYTFTDDTTNTDLEAEIKPLNAGINLALEKAIALNSFELVPKIALAHSVDLLKDVQITGTQGTNNTVVDFGVSLDKTEMTRLDFETGFRFDDTNNNGNFSSSVTLAPRVSCETTTASDEVECFGGARIEVSNISRRDGWSGNGSLSYERQPDKDHKLSGVLSFNKKIGDEGFANFNFDMNGSHTGDQGDYGVNTGFTITGF